DPRALRQRLSALPSPCPRLQLFTLLTNQNNLNRYRTWHAPSLRLATDGLMTHDTSQLLPVIVAIGAPAWIGAPSLTGSSEIVPALCAVISFSIFMASMITSSWPSCTVSPGLTGTFHTFPCSGEVSVSELSPPRACTRAARRRARASA